LLKKKERILTNNIYSEWQIWETHPSHLTPQHYSLLFLTGWL
jgi:hypothetical protein